MATGPDQHQLQPLRAWLRRQGRIILAAQFRLQRRLRRALDQLLPRLRRGEHVFIIVAAIIIGLLSGYGAIAFRTLISLVHRLFFATSEYSLACVIGVLLSGREISSSGSSVLQIGRR